MRIRILRARHYVAIGAKDAGDELTVDAAYGRQLCQQGFAEEVRRPKTESKVKEGGNDG